MRGPRLDGAVRAVPVLDFELVKKKTRMQEDPDAFEAAANIFFATEPAGHYHHLRARIRTRRIVVKKLPHSPNPKNLKI
jgi:hypothetical protein